MNMTSASPADAGRAHSAPAPSRRTVDAPTRAFHWLFALSFVGAYLTADGERWRMVHVTLGYTLIGLIVFRLVWGLFGPHHARLSQWFTRLHGAPALLRSLRDGRSSLAAVRPVLNALAVVCLLGLAVLATASGYALYDEAFGGAMEDLLEELHETAGNAMLTFVLLHVALILIGALFKGRQQAWAMVTGRVPGRGPDLVKRNQTLLGGLLIASAVAFWVWQWQTAPNGGGQGGGRAEQVHQTQDRGNRRGHDDDD
jgi:cytochrome b